MPRTEIYLSNKLLWHPWLRINRVMRVMLHTRWSSEQWSVVRVEFRQTVALRSQTDTWRGLTNSCRLEGGIGAALSGARGVVMGGYSTSLYLGLAAGSFALGPAITSQGYEVGFALGGAGARGVRGVPGGAGAG